MAHGVVSERYEGTPQGGPLSPLLANVLLDEVDRELEQRGHRFVRYADDCNVYVSEPAGGRAGAGRPARLYARLRLKVNEAKTAVAGVWGRKFLGYCFWDGPRGGQAGGGRTRRWTTCKQRIRQLTRRSGGRSLSEVADDLQALRAGLEGVLPAGADAQGLARTRRVAAAPAARGAAQALAAGHDDVPGIAALGASVDQAAHRGRHSARRWWRNSRMALNRVLPIAYFDRLGVPRALLTSTSRTARCGPAFGDGCFGDANSCAPYFYGRYVRRRAWQVDDGDEDIDAGSLIGGFRKSDRDCATAFSSPAGLPLFDEQKKSRVRSHLSA